MDLFQKLGLRLLSWEENMKIFNEEENKKKYVKEGILKNNEHVLLVETKKLNELTNEIFIRIHHFLINQPFNFINLKYVLIKEDIDMYFAYEKTGPTLMEYLEKTECNLEIRLLIFKQAVEIVYYLIYLDENFTHFDFNLFFVEISEINPINRLPILKLIPNCDFLNKAKNQNSAEYASKNYFFWLFYLQFLIFKDNSNLSGNLKDSRFITEDIRLLANILIDIISENNSKNLTIENLIEFINCILKKFNIREIKIDIKHNNLLRNGNNNEYKKHNIYGYNSNVPLNYNLLGVNKTPMNPHAYNLHPHQNMFLNMNNMNSIGSLHIPNNISQNLNNSQINYHQYFQFFQNNNSNYNNIAFVPQNENFPLFMNQSNPNLPGKLIYNQSNLQNFYTPNVGNIISPGLNNGNSGVNQTMHGINYFDEFNLINNNSFYQAGSINPIQNANPMWNYELIKNINDSLSLSNNNSFYQIKNNRAFNEVLNNNMGNFSIKPGVVSDSNNQNKFSNFSKENQELNKSNSSNITTNNINNNSSSNLLFSVENFFNDKQEKVPFQNAKDSKIKAKKFNCENDAVIVIHELNNIPIRFDIVFEKKILSKILETDISKILDDDNLIINNPIICEDTPNIENLNKKRTRSENLISEEASNEIEINIGKKKGPKGKKVRRKSNQPKFTYDCFQNENNYTNPNQKSTLLNYQNLDEKDLEMIKNIDNPRRKKVKLKFPKESEKKRFFTTETNQHLLNEFINYMPKFEEELNEYTKLKSHQFMKSNFPEMYNVENFYLHIKLIKEKRDTKLRSLVTQIHQTEIISNETKNELEIKQIWDCKRLKPSEVDNFLFQVEKQWPLDEYIWSQESALEFLSSNYYDVEKTIQLIKNSSEEFKLFLDLKRLNRKYHNNVSFEVDKISKRRIRYKY